MLLSEVRARSAGPSDPLTRSPRKDGPGSAGTMENRPWPRHPPAAIRNAPHAEIYRDRLEAIEAIEAFAHDPAAFGAVPGNPDYDQPMGAARRARALAHAGAMLPADAAEHRNPGIAERPEPARAAAPT